MTIMNGIKAHLLSAAQSSAQPRWGIVQGYNSEDHTATVNIQPEDITTEFLPIATPTAGQGVGVWIAPTPGQMAFLVPDTGHVDNYVIAGFGFSDVNPLPQIGNAIGGSPVPLQAGEIAFAGLGGSVIRMAADGTIYLKANTVNIDGMLHVSGQANFDQEVLAVGNIESQADVKDSVDTLNNLRTDYNGHEHPGGFGSPPSPTDSPDN